MMTWLAQISTCWRVWMTRVRRWVILRRAPSKMRPRSRYFSTGTNGRVTMRSRAATKGPRMELKRQGDGLRRSCRGTSSHRWISRVCAALRGSSARCWMHILILLESRSGMTERSVRAETCQNLLETWARAEISSRERYDNISSITSVGRVVMPSRMVAVEGASVCFTGWRFYLSRFCEVVEVQAQSWQAHVAT